MRDRRSPEPRTRPVAVAAENRVVLEGQVWRSPQTRVNPAQVPLTRFILEHRSRQSAGGFEREAMLRLVVVASGHELSRIAAEFKAGDRMRVEGYLSRSSYQADEREIALQAVELRRL